jgi:thiol peroxidase
MITNAQGGIMPRTTTFKGSPLELAGPELKVGDPAPDFKAVNKILQPVTLKDTGANVRIFSVVPSLDTPVCDAQTKRFNDAAAKLAGVDIFTISADLPFAQNRWCTTFGIDHVKMLSDHKDASFGAAYGTLIKDWRVESRAIFILDRSNKIAYAEYVGEVADHPNYEAALAKARDLAAG